MFTHAYDFIGGFHLMCIDPCLYENKAFKIKRLMSMKFI